MYTDKFVNRHNGPRKEDVQVMLDKMGLKSIDELIDQTVPKSIHLEKELDMEDGISEYEYLNNLKAIAQKNKNYRSFIGMGYYGTMTPPVVQRNVLENPAWYTSYTPYQAEISQGRLEALLNYQTMVSDLTGMELANASLLDEATAAAEAMIMMFNMRKRAAVKAGVNTFFVDKNVFPQTMAVLNTRALPLGIEIVTGDYKTFEFTDKIYGAMVQFPAADGKVEDYKEFVDKAHNTEALVGVAADLLSLALLTPPGEWGADMVFGSTQRFGLPMAYGGPHAGFFATHEKYKRNVPGRIIGVSVDTNGKTALRMALQTREQHIKRERATSNICTAQALLANMSGMFAVYHGKEGIENIARHAHLSACLLNDKLKELGYEQENEFYFDTLKIKLPANVSQNKIKEAALNAEMNFNYIDEQTVGISTDELTTLTEINTITKVFAEAIGKSVSNADALCEECRILEGLKRTSDFLTLPAFKKYRSETEMMRYIKKLERKDFSLAHSMISLGSCTMKLNAATELFALSWPEFGNVHPFVPQDQAQGYGQLISELESDLKVITGFDAVSFQPNSGAAGEYTGLMVIRKYQESIGQGHRNVVLIPSSAHGTNPASAAMAGAKIVIVDCDSNGNIDINDLKEKAEANRDNLSSFMVTYPSTHGVFESRIKEMNEIIHENGGLVYMDGANMNAQVGITNPATIGADVCHLNLHKTFAIPHGGGGPGVGPIGVTAKLVKFLPSHPVVKVSENEDIDAVAAAPYGSAGVLTISHAYLKLMGGKGLTEATKMAILNANYVAKALNEYYDVLYTGETGRVAHEMILDCRKFKHEMNTDITETDVAKRLMDYGFHAPTLSFPVHGTLMMEPTESESLEELDRFIEAMISIRKEIDAVANGDCDAADNALRNAPHTMDVVSANEWNHKYSRELAAYPLEWVRENKFFPTTGRIDDAYGDRNLVCTCAPIEDYR